MKVVGRVRALGVGWPGRRGRLLSCLAIAAGLGMAGAQPAAAQDLSEEEVITLGLMGEETAARGIDGSSDVQMADVLGLAWGYGLSDLDASPNDAWDIVQSYEEDRDRIAKLAAAFSGRGPAFSPMLIRFGQKLSCDEAKRKSDQAKRVGTALKKVAGMYAAGLTVLSASSTLAGPVAARFTWPLGFGAIVAGTLAGYADDLAVAYLNAPCGAAGGAGWILESIRAGGTPMMPTSRWLSPSACPRRSGWAPVG